MTLHTLAIVLRQSVVFSTGKSVFCWQTQKHKAFGFVSVAGTDWSRDRGCVSSGTDL